MSSPSLPSLALILGGLLFTNQLVAQGPPPLTPLNSPAPAPAGNAITTAKTNLGKVLFWDEQLSSTRTISCGSCHQPVTGGSDPRSLVGDPNSTNPGPDGILGNADDITGSPGVILNNADGTYSLDDFFGMAQQVTGRYAPSTINAGFPDELFWDGRATAQFRDPITNNVVLTTGAALESQAAGPPLSSAEMAHQSRDWVSVAARIAGVKPLAVATNIPTALDTWIDSRNYPALFAEAFGDTAVTPARIIMAIATYERVLVSNQAPFDAFIGGNNNALTTEEARGLGVFNGRGRCTTCHGGNRLTDDDFHYIGVRPQDDDLGRFDVTGNNQHRGQFKTPTLRNVALRGEFMHNGRFATLAQVVAFYNRGGDFNAANKNNNVRPLGLNATEQSDLVAFLSRPLTDPRVANETAPFDHPAMFENSANQPSITGSGVAGSGGFTPNIVAIEPPLAGNPSFTIGVNGALGGASAVLVIDSDEPASGTGIPAASDVQMRFPITLGETGAGNGFGSVVVPLPDGLAGTSFKARWYISDMDATGGVSESQVASFTIFGSSAGILTTPTNINITEDSATQATISWNAVTDADKYQVFRGSSSNLSEATLVGETTSTQLADTEFGAASPTGYWVAAVGENEAVSSAVATLPEPEISVEEPVNVTLIDNSSSIDFGSTDLAGLMTKTFTIRNTGNGTLRDLAASIDGSNAAEFSAGAFGATTLTTGQSTTLTVSFSPTASGVRNAALHIASNDSDENPFDISLTGVGAPPEIGIQTSDGIELTDAGSSIDLGTNFSGVTSSQVITIRNDGTGTLTGLSALIDGTNSSDFSAGSFGATSVASGEETTLTISFTPTATGSRTANLRIASNDDNENPFDIILTGTGRSPAPEISVSESINGDLTSAVSTVDFGTVTPNSTGSPLTFTIQNDGNLPLTGLSTTIDGIEASEFASTVLGASSLNPGESTTVSLSFTPTDIGLRQASLTITSNDDEATFAINLKGYGTASEMEISVTEPVDSELADGVSTIGFGVTDPGEPILKTVTIRNIGATDLTSLAISVDGPQAAEFVASTISSSTLGSGESTQFTITFDPTSAGLREAALHITSNDADENPFDIELRGNGTSPGSEISVEYPVNIDLTDNTSSVDYGLSSIGFTTELTFTIRNAGEDQLNSLAATIDGENAADFSLGALSQTSLEKGESTELTISWTPTGLGSRSAALHITSNDADENPFDISLTGTVPTPEITIEHPVDTELTDGSSTVDFGESGTGVPVELTFVIKNDGAAALTSLATSIDGTNASEFVAASLSATSINPGESLELDVTFTPTASGARSANLQIISDDQDENPFDIALTGSGIAVSVPEDVTITTSDGNVNLSWAASVGASSYNIYRSVDGTLENAEEMSSTSSNQYQDSSTHDGVTYTYWVEASNGATSTMSATPLSARSRSPHAMIASTSTTISSVVASDFDNDGTADLILQNQTSGEIGFWHLNENGSVKGGAVLSINPGADWQLVNHADFDEDSTPDLLLRNQQTGELAVWALDGTDLDVDSSLPIETNSSPFTQSVNWKVAGIYQDAASFDLITQNSDTGQIAYHSVNGRLNDAYQISDGELYETQPTDSKWKLLGVRDFNQDGNADLFWQNQSAGTFAVWYLDAQKKLLSAAAISSQPENAETTARGIEDWNGDGNTDICIQNTETGEIQLWYLQGTNVQSIVPITDSPETNWEVRNSDQGR